ncbi:DUF4097 and DUF4098 domain-containing protein YvlB [Luteibacter sp. Sphag1AF]|uniref:hypothetical protein n=1 Tax=Luteibacter sp. Sphag1AF TaxID=2587031 RepID=UPI001622876D|nr:hypothetical protein [Luteibacter sp. Sphag1AF]MBB3226361.1 DUF4097 and DUF4098 domain-containing protein YvlB [Luteibacter sp. Sphag1AF]
MHRQLLSLLVAATLSASAFAGDTDVSKVNGAARVEAGQTAGDVSTVNGSVQVEAGAHVKKADTVNGSVNLGDSATANALETVNGAISMGAKAQVATTVETVNGGIHLNQGADVRGRASNVNGSIVLEAAHVGGGLETVNGDIDVGANSRVEGGILVKKPSWFSSSSRLPRVVIGPNAVVQGPLEFRRDVELHVSDKATIGPVTGATPVKFSGATP